MKASDTSEIRKVWADFERFYAEGNSRSLAALWEPDGDLHTLSGGIAKGRKKIEAFLADTLSKNYRGSRFRLDLEAHRFLDPAVAIADGRWEVTGDSLPKGYPTRGTYTMILVKRSGRWKIAAARPQVVLSGHTKNMGRKPAVSDITESAIKAAVQRRFPPFQGCFLLRELRSGNTWSSGAALCSKRFAPCSTFKIINSAIALETGVATGTDMTLPWDGKKKYFRVWERDHTLRTAFKHSVVWYYQHLAKKVGRKRMQSFIDKLGYGNRTVTGPITTFWLDGSLGISANEQLATISSLYKGENPFSERTISAVHSLIEDADPLPGFGGKTGTCLRLYAYDAVAAVSALG